VYEQQTGSIFPFVYAVKPDNTRAPQAGVQRDAGALLPLAWILGQEGRRLDYAWHNYPEHPYRPQPPTIAEHSNLDYSRARPGDYFVQPTRPPLDDELEGIRKYVPRGGTTLELKIAKFWSQFFQFCGRGSVCLTGDVQRGLLQGFESYRNMGFRLNKSSDVVQVASGKPSIAGSVAFFLRTDAIWEGGPGLFSAWGMDANHTYTWAWILYDRMRHLAQRRGLFMVALESPEEQRFRGDYAAIANDWKATVVLEHEFTDEL
jgi:hypothetical protein